MTRREVSKRLREEYGPRYKAGQRFERPVKARLRMASCEEVDHGQASRKV